MRFFKKKITLDLSDEDIARMDKIIDHLSLKYGSRAHFIRCAIIKLIKYEASKTLGNTTGDIYGNTEKTV